jgi:hypothetical protein
MNRGTRCVPTSCYVFNSSSIEEVNLFAGSSNSITFCIDAGHVIFAPIVSIVLTVHIAICRNHYKLLRCICLYIFAKK